MNIIVANKLRKVFGNGVELLALDDVDLTILGGEFLSITGPSGSGKSTLAAQFAHAATQRGEPCAMFLFEEARSKLLNRTDNVGMRLQAALDTGLLSVQQVDPAELTPGEFARPWSMRRNGAPGSSSSIA